MRSIGIDIGRYSIKVVEVLAANRTQQIIKAKEYKILNPETSDQEIDILQTLKQISQEFDTESAKVSCSIRQQYVSTRKLFFPFKERVKIQKSLAFELEDDIPLSIEKAIYDSKIIKFHDKSAEVIAMACVMDEIEKTIDIMNRGHVDPDIITPEFCAISNLYEKWYKVPEEAVEDSETTPNQPDKMIVHIGHSKTFVGVVSKSHLVWGRSIMWGAEKVASAISQSFQVPFMTALDMMPNKAFVLLSSSGASKDQLKMSETVSKAFAPLVQSLRLTMMLANTEYGANIEEVEFLGGASHIKNIGPFFTQELERPTNAENPLEKMDTSYMKGVRQLKDNFQMALGLAIEGLKRPANPPINFRQLEFAKKNQSFEKFWEKWNYTAKLVGIAYFCYVVYGFAIDSLATGLEEASN
ncbi:MAG: pilus assembly protein PilM, partial [Pseudomonadota bacterium]